MPFTRHRGQKAPSGAALGRGHRARPPELPWRGPGPGRPELPLPPGPMPLRSAGQNRKRWRYVGVFDDRVMLCCARAEVGPLVQSFWILWDREGRRHRARTTQRPGSREVVFDGPSVEIDSPGLRASLRLGEAAPVESICPSPGGEGWGWTRKRAGVPVMGTIEIPGRRWGVESRAVDDESAGYHSRRTCWRWSAGVGRAADGHELAWNLVEGVNDPPRGSERAIWFDGNPEEPPPVRFLGNTGVEIPGGGALAFHSESAHAGDENLLAIRSRYRHRFGSFSGRLGGIQLASGLGVMEEHAAVW